MRPVLRRWPSFSGAGPLAGLALALWGIAMIMGGTFPMPDERHGAFGLGLTAPFIPLFTLLSLGNAPASGAMRAFLALVVAGSAVLMAIMMGVGGLVTHANVGLWQRINSGFAIPWLAVAGWWLLARGRAAAVDITRGDDARIFLAPLGHRNALPRPAIGRPETLAIAREPARVAVLHEVGSAAGRRIVVVVLEHVAKAGDGVLVAVAEIEADDFQVRAVGLHAGGEATHVHVAVVALRTRIGERWIAEHQQSGRIEFDSGFSGKFRLIDFAEKPNAFRGNVLLEPRYRLLETVAAFDAHDAVIRFRHDLR